MYRNRFVGICIATLCSVLLAISVSCASGQSGDLPISKAITPVYTPMVMISEGSTLPSDAALVSIEDLAAHPTQYADQFIEVHGLNAGVYARPACYPRFDQPSEWLLVTGPTTHQNNVTYQPPRIEVKNTFGGMVSDPTDLTGRAIRNTMMKQAVVWGWWRLYDGPLGCGSVNAQGTPIPPPNQQTWYLDAVKLQYLESIEVPIPTKK